MKAINLRMPSFFVTLVFSGLAMVGVQGFVEYRMLRPITQATEKLGDDVYRLQAQAASQPAAVPKTQTQLDVILAHLPMQGATTERVERMHLLADQNGVVVRKASYPAPTKPSAIVRQEMTADLGGTYPAIRQFLRAVLLEDQALAVESVEFSRLNGGGVTSVSSGVGTVPVRAQVRFALYSRAASP